MEQCWFHNVCTAHEAAEEYLADNKKSFVIHSNLIHSDLVPAAKKLEWIKSQQKTVEGWALGVAKGNRLRDLERQHDRAVERQKKVETQYGKSYFDGLRIYLRGLGFSFPRAIFRPPPFFRVKTGSR
jgi:hypothetical protein